MENLEKFGQSAIYRVVEGIVSDAIFEPKIIMLSMMITDENESVRVLDLCRSYVTKIIIKLLNDGIAKIIVDNEDNPKGYAFLINMGGNFCIQHLYVNESERKKGIAKNIVKQIKLSGKSIGLISSITASPFWKKIGFKLESEEMFGNLMTFRAKKEDEVGVFKLSNYDIDKFKKIMISGEVK